ncbi:class I SAM-dependent methyltransferase [Terrisporobacter petrolearius]|uniref:class I SAM-dependent methyltransferase n=1 Tax=Terrisporobacter petrolearius TaxID=1460447 RepID=UPI001D167D29
MVYYEAQGGPKVGTTGLFGRQYSDASVIALDFSPNMIEMTKKRVGNKAKVIKADLNEPLHFIEDKSIDVILSSLKLHYIKSWNLVMSEFNRILKRY